MKKTINGVIVISGMFLVLNGLMNIFDNGMVLAYDITSILSGLGFILVVFNHLKN